MIVGMCGQLREVTDDAAIVEREGLFYEVHVRYEAGTGNRILSTRSTPHRTQQPFLATPRDQEVLDGGSTEVRFRGMAEPGSNLTVWVDGAPLTTVTTLVDGSFTHTHDFLVPGSHTVFVQAKAAGKSISVLSMEADFTIP